MTAEHPPSPETSLLEHDAAAQPTTLAQQTLQQTVQQVVAQQVQQAQHVQHAQHPSHAQVHQTHPQQVQVQQDHANGAIHAPQPRQKTPSSRRGKQYKCGQCGELGHNSKTCPRRGPGGAEAAVIQPALDAADMFGVGSLGTPVGRTTGPVPAVGRIQPLKLEAAIDAANRRVLNAESAVAGAQTNEDFEEATSALDLAVSQLERIGACAKRCALVAYSLSTPSMDISPTPALREGKRLRLDSAAQPIAPRLDEDGQEVQQQDPDALPKLETEE